MTRVALVGLGDIGLRAHLPALLTDRGAELVAVADPDAGARERALLAAGGAPHAVDDLDDALALGVDAVVLATPPWVTTDLARRALEADRFVLAEKPVATSVAAAAPLRALGAERAARLQVGLTYRHDPAIERLRDWIAARRLGAPLLVRAHVYDERRDPADPEHAARVEAALRHGSPLLHDGAHLFDWLAVLLGGAPERVEDAWALRTDPATPAPHLTGARLVWPDGTTALVEVGWWLPVLPRCELEVVGDGGRALLDLRTFDLRGEFESETQDVRFPGERMARCFARQLERFLALCEGRGPASPGLEEGLASLALSERVAAAAGLATAETPA